MSDDSVWDAVILIGCGGGDYCNRMQTETRVAMESLHDGDGGGAFAYDDSGTPPESAASQCPLEQVAEQGHERAGLQESDEEYGARVEFRFTGEECGCAEQEVNASSGGGGAADLLSRMEGDGGI